MREFRCLDKVQWEVGEILGLSFEMGFYFSDELLNPGRRNRGSPLALGHPFQVRLNTLSRRFGKKKRRNPLNVPTHPANPQRGRKGNPGCFLFLHLHPCLLIIQDHSCFPVSIAVMIIPFPKVYQNQPTKINFFRLSGITPSRINQCRGSASLVKESDRIIAFTGLRFRNDRKSIAIYRAPAKGLGYFRPFFILMLLPYNSLLNAAIPASSECMASCNFHLATFILL